MKRGILLLLLVFVSFVSADIEIHNYSLGDVSSSIEAINGEVNLTIIDEDYTTKITSSDGDEMELGEFLDLNGVIFECSPSDCLSGYNYSTDIAGMVFNISPIEEKTVGFVFEGGIIEIESLYFEIESDFGETIKRPLSIDFFGDKDYWRFEKFSDTFLDKDWGCYDESTLSAVPGPLIGVDPYCELIYVPETDKIKVGAEIKHPDEIENNNLTMYLYPESGTGGSWDCSYYPSSENDGCILESTKPNVFSAGNYQVCVGAEKLTKYKVYTEEIGDNCGFPHGSGPYESVKDYGIFAQGVKYADASFLDEAFEFDVDEVVANANEFLDVRYNYGDCSRGCVLPLTFSGVTQRARVKNVDITYKIDGEYAKMYEIYDLEESPAIVNFEGVLDLRILNFSVSESMNYTLSIGEREVFSKIFNISTVPKIISVLPLDPPAGVPAKFYVNVEFEGNKSLTYNWDFGDDTKETTFEPYVTHTYEDLRNYTLSVEVSAGGDLKDSKPFDIQTITPRAAIDSGLASKKGFVDSVKAIIDDVPEWYGRELSKMANVEEVSRQLTTLEKNKQGATSDQDFIKIAEELYALNVPVEISVNSFSKPYLMNTLEDVNINPVLAISGELVGGSNDDYSSPILNWQNTNIEASSSRKVYEVLLWSGESAGFLSTYTFDVKSKSAEDSYFVIDAPLSGLHFSVDVGAEEAEEFTVVSLSPNVEGYFEFYYKNSEPLSHFVSPKLSSIVIELDIDTTCNYNSICEKELGETSDTCRSDCKPIRGAIFYGILALLFVLVLYFLLQIWYNRRYEKYLFKDSRELYNLLMFVANAKTRGMNDSKIASNLKGQGWSGERVNFVIKKSNGKRTGLPEIIPLSKISAMLRNAKARREQAANAKNQQDSMGTRGSSSSAGRPQRASYGKNDGATGYRQQSARNINKSRFQDRV